MATGGLPTVSGRGRRWFKSIGAIACWWSCRRAGIERTVRGRGHSASRGESVRRCEGSSQLYEVSPG
jgi:hypothetical protein